MRTNTANVSRNVFGFGQDGVVSLRNDSCAHAAQHLQLRHAAKRARGSALALKRLWSTAVAVGAAPKAKWTCLVITGPMRLTVRQMSPVVVAG